MTDKTNKDGTTPSQPTPDEVQNSLDQVKAEKESKETIRVKLPKDE